MEDIGELLGEGMPLMNVFGSIFLTFLAIGCIAVGVFLVYFGNKAKQGWGAAQLAIGILFLVLDLWLMGVMPLTSPVGWDLGHLVIGIVAGLAMVLGIGAAAGMFLMIVMKRKTYAGAS